jgi:hypothetical protein
MIGCSVIWIKSFDIVILARTVRHTGRLAVGFQRGAEDVRIISTLVAFLVALFYRPGNEPELQLRDGDGELGKFIIDRIGKLDGHVTPLSDVPAIEGEWRSQEDDQGVVIHLPTLRFPQVENFLKGALGEPAQEPTPGTDGSMMGWYGPEEIGLVLQFGYDSDHTFVCIVRPQSPWQLLKQIPRSYLKRK